jgi:hypothetical protein
LKVKAQHSGTLFILEEPFNGRSKWLFLFYAIAFLTPAVFLMLLLVKMAETTGEAFFLGSVVIICIIAAYRYLSSAWRKDTLLITGDSVVLVEQKGLSQRKQVFDKSKISDLRFLAKPVITEHALAGKTYDYLGFQTQQIVISEVFGDDRIAFDYDEKTISFGRKLYSWDFDAIRQELTGPDETEEELPWDVEMFKFKS